MYSGIKNLRKLLIRAFLYSYSVYGHTTVKHNKYFSSDGCYVYSSQQLCGDNSAGLVPFDSLLTCMVLLGIFTV
jgi:hypothetical protein